VLWRECGKQHDASAGKVCPRRVCNKTKAYSDEDEYGRIVKSAMECSADGAWTNAVMHAALPILAGKID
jgi:hypothetical protein